VDISAPALLTSPELELSFAQRSKVLINHLVCHAVECGWIPPRLLVLIYQRSTDPCGKGKSAIEHAMDRFGRLVPTRGLVKAASRAYRSRCSAYAHRLAALAR
jgi:hypothetical protein